jgi:hypothetical protein
VASDKFSTGNLRLAELFSNAAALRRGGVRFHAASLSRSGSSILSNDGTTTNLRLSIFIEVSLPSAMAS